MIGLNERGQQAGIFKGDGYKGLAALLNIVLLHKDEFISYKEEVELHLKSIFSTSVSIEMNDEFLCAALIELDSKIIACGLGYHRKMYQGDHCFKAGIIGSVAVHADFQQQGLCRTIIQQIDACLISENVLHSFLFAYQPEIYLSSGYVNLNVPIHFYDKQKEKWTQFIYRGGMVKSYVKSHPLENGNIDFRGCVY